MTAGGFTYHLRARRSSDRRWRPFRNQVAGWLREWKPKADHLIIFGSSAGYTLNQDFLLRFDRVSIIEPDAMARFLFKKRFPRIGAHVLDAAYLLKNLDLQEWRNFGARHPGSAFLFSNVVGQMIFIQSKTAEPIEQRVTRLFTYLSRELDVSWASYHDILSAGATPQTLIPFTLKSGTDTVDSLAREKLRGTTIEVIDHGTLEASYAVNAEVPCAWWEIEPLRYHLVGWLSHT